MNNLQSSGQLTIGALAQRTGFNVSAIRYYEEVGLIPEAMRRPSGHRVYSPDVQEVLTLVKHCRDFGFSIEETRAMVSLSTSNDRDCAETRQIAQTHLNTIRSKLAELQNLERSLSKFVQACTDQCVGGPAPKCSILKDLSVADSKLAAPARCCG
ncbi:HTH-type transcriptional regulator HmrR [compost metagenome]|uniref:Helix-turn-helix domain-containing protein n=1 Tax=Polaromonas aquatica TaxID=332657 RepID=A0ABW1TSZ7_9BURK